MKYLMLFLVVVNFTCFFYHFSLVSAEIDAHTHIMIGNLNLFAAMICTMAIGD
jgi:hypothetical protein